MLAVGMDMRAAGSWCEMHLCKGRHQPSGAPPRTQHLWHVEVGGLCASHTCCCSRISNVTVFRSFLLFPFLFFHFLFSFCFVPALSPGTDGVRDGVGSRGVAPHAYRPRHPPCCRRFCGGGERGLRRSGGWRGIASGAAVAARSAAAHTAGPPAVAGHEGGRCEGPALHRQAHRVGGAHPGL